MSYKGPCTFYYPIQLFRGRLSEKVNATIPKGIVGDFEFTVLQRNLKKWYERPWTYVWKCQRKATKLSSTATVSGTVYWSYPILPFGIVAYTFFSDNLSRNSCILWISHRKSRAHAIKMRKKKRTGSSLVCYWQRLYCFLMLSTRSNYLKNSSSELKYFRGLQ